MLLSSIEKLLLLILLVGSAYAVWFRFARIVREIQKAKTDTSFSLRPIKRRIVHFVWEVMLQAKVIRDRSLPGIAHAFVCWGFCAFALVTLNHFAIGIGRPFLSRERCSGCSISISPRCLESPWRYR